MNARKMNLKADYDLCLKWWEARNVRPLALEALPETGVIVEMDSGTPIAAVWLYLSNSKLAWIGWTLVSPQAKPRESFEAIRVAFEALEQLARLLGCTVLCGTTNGRGLSKSVVRLGYTNAGNHDLYFKELK